MIKSSSSSSTRRTLIKDECQYVVSFAIGQFDSLQPILGEQPHEFDERVELDWFRNKGIGAQLVSFFDIGVSLRRGQNHHRDAFEFAMGFHFAQNLAAIFSRHIEVEQN